MSNPPNQTKTAAVTAAKDDKKETGPAGLPGTKPVSAKPRLSPEAKAQREAELEADQVRNIEYRASQICNLLVEMGSSSMAQRITNYKAAPYAIAEAAVVSIRERMAVVEAALAQRKAAADKPTTTDGKPQKFSLNLRAAAGAPVQR